jgi:hypothetical protein
MFVLVGVVSTLFLLLSVAYGPSLASTAYSPEDGDSPAPCRMSVGGVERRLHCHSPGLT